MYLLFLISFPLLVSYTARHPSLDPYYDVVYAILPDWWRRKIIRIWMDDIDTKAWRMWVRQDNLEP